MVTGVEHLCNLYADIGTDIFKTAISAPGFAWQMVFKTGKDAGGSFDLFDETNKDLYDTIKKKYYWWTIYLFLL